MKDNRQLENMYDEIQKRATMNSSAALRTDGMMTHDQPFRFQPEILIASIKATLAVCFEAIRLGGCRGVPSAKKTVATT